MGWGGHQTQPAAPAHPSPVSGLSPSTASSPVEALGAPTRDKRPGPAKGRLKNGAAAPDARGERDRQRKRGLREARACGLRRRSAPFRSCSSLGFGLLRAFMFIYRHPPHATGPLIARTKAPSRLPCLPDCPSSRTKQYNRAGRSPYTGLWTVNDTELTQRGEGIHRGDDANCQSLRSLRLLLVLPQPRRRRPALSPAPQQFPMRMLPSLMPGRTTASHTLAWNRVP